jgi:type I restriction enzyme S subunit
MTLSLVVEHFDDLLATSEDVEQLNYAILDLAVRGKLTRREAGDESAKELLKKLHKGSSLPQSKDHKEPFELPEGWEWFRFKDISEIYGGKTPSMNQSKYWDGDIPWVSPKDMWEDVVVGSEMMITTDALDQMRLVPEDSLLIVVRSGILKRKLPVSINAVPCTVNQDLKVIVPNVSGMSRYIQLMLQGLQPLILKTLVKQGTTVQSVKWDEFITALFPLPPLAEQQRIVARVEELFVQTRALAKELAHSQIELDGLNKSALSHLLASETPEEFNQHWDFIAEHFDLLFQTPEHVAPLRQSILELAVRGKLTRREAGDESAGELLKRISEEKKSLIENGELRKEKPPLPNKEDEKPFELPKGWEWVKLIEISQLITDGTHKTPDYQPKGVPFISVNNMLGDKISFSRAKYISQEEHVELTKRCKPEKGDILLGKVASVGVCDVVNADFEFSIFVQIALIKLFKNEINSYYLKYAIMSKTIQSQIARFASGTTIKYIGINKINLLDIPLPSLAEQERIVKRVEQLLSLCDALEARLQSAEEERGRLVAAVMSTVGG